MFICHSKRRSTGVESPGSIVKEWPLNFGTGWEVLGQMEAGRWVFRAPPKLSRLPPSLFSPLPYPPHLSS